MVRVSASFLVILSFATTALTIANAFMHKKQFYPSVVYLTKSNPSMAVLYFQAAVFSYLIFIVLRMIFFGQLRVAEIEHAQERVWHAVLETCLAFTVFRDDFSPKFVVQFVVLLFIKTFHWLAEDRVDYMERSPVITVLYHARIMGILSLISAIDSYFISYAFFTTLLRGATAQVVFGFEYAILLTAVAHIAIKYILHIHDLRSAHPSENKAVYMLYAELFVNFLRCVLYMLFAIVMFKIHTLPLFVIRPFYSTIRSLQKAINDVIQSRRAINAMNNLFPLATEQELEEGDNTCIICREEMTANSGAKKLPCNHIFHPNCLRSWFQRQQTCPTCRTDVLAHRGTATAQTAAAVGGQAPVNQINFGAQANFVNPMLNFGGPFGQMGGFIPQNQQQAQMQNQPPPNTSAQQLPGAAVGIQQPLRPMYMPMNMVMMPYMPPVMPMYRVPQIMRFPMAPPVANPTQPNLANQMGTSTAASTDTQQPSTSTDSATTTTSAAAAAAETSSTSPTLNSTETGSQPPTQSSSMPMFNVPPFPQPPTFAGFTDAEITQMEGHERNAVENRIQALRNISVLLDAAMLQFQQYLSIAVTPSSSSMIPRASASGQSGAASTATREAGQHSAAASSSASTVTDVTTTADDMRRDTGGRTDSTEEEIRRRRLQRFNSSAVQ